MNDDIVAFIRARVDEDVRVAAKALPMPARVLRAVEAKRRIVARHRVVTEMWAIGDDLVDVDLCGTCAYGEICNHCFDREDRTDVEWPCPELRLLASEWSDHEDYRQEWTP